MSTTFDNCPKMPIIPTLNNSILNAPAWNDLDEYFKQHNHTLSDVRSMFIKDPKRFQNWSLSLPLISSSSSSLSFPLQNDNDQSQFLLLDYSKNRIDHPALELLFKLARQCKVEERREQMFRGDPINTTEGRSVLHVALRNAPWENNSKLIISSTGEDVMTGIRRELIVMERISEAIRDGSWKGFQGDIITDIVNIGIGGSDLGPVMVCEALKSYHNRSGASLSPLRIHHVSNVDGTHLIETLKGLNAARTLFIIVSKTFTTVETMTNAHSARSWLLHQFGLASTNNSSESTSINAAVAKHFVAISTNEIGAKEFGISPENMIRFWDWVGGRYSLWSAVGFSIMLAIGKDQFRELLHGAHMMDEHFQHAPLEKNMPVIMALLGVWYNNYFGAQSHAILPYEQYLHRFPAYLQQADMESNGKLARLHGNEVQIEPKLDDGSLRYQTGPIIWGEPGTNGQHAFFQLLHQGSKLIPADFIVGIKPASSHVGSMIPTGIDVDKHHLMLLANCIAQTEALMRGKSCDKVGKELQLSKLDNDQIHNLIPHKIFPGNRPSNTLLYERLTPRTLGALIALYEHKIFVQGVIWDVNSFDQWGVELGKQLAGVVLKELEERQIDRCAHDGSTNGLLEFILKH